MVDEQVEVNTCINTDAMEVNLRAIRELRDGIQEALLHDRLISLRLTDVLVCHGSELAVVEVD